MKAGSSYHCQMRAGNIFNRYHTVPRELSTHFGNDLILTDEPRFTAGRWRKASSASLRIQMWPGDVIGVSKESHPVWLAHRQM